MADEERKLKITDVSFSASFKFWLAYLAVQIIAMLIVMGIMFAAMGWILTEMRGLTPTYSTILTGKLSTIF